MKKLNVKEAVLAKLRSINVDLCNKIIEESHSTLDFWKNVDLNFDYQTVKTLRNSDIVNHSISKEFTPSFLIPSFECMNQVYNEKQGKSSDGVENTNLEFTKEDVEEYLQKNSKWSLIDNYWYFESVKDQPFGTNLLFNACEALIKDKKPWQYLIVFSDIYERIYLFITNNNIDHRLFELVYNKLKFLEYSNSSQVDDDLKLNTGINFQINEDLCKHLRYLMENICYKNKTENPLYHHSTRSWAESKLDIILENGPKPISNQRPYKFTAKTVDARLSGNGYSIEKGSLDDLLYMTEDNDIAPMPYSCISADIKVKDTEEFANMAIRRFTLLFLMDSNFTSVSRESLNIICDWQRNILEDIAHIASDEQRRCNNTNTAVERSLRRMSMLFNKI